MSWEQLEEPHRAGSSQGLTQPPFMPGRIGETEAGTRRAERCFPWADPAFWFHSSPPWLVSLDCHIPRLFLGVGQALSPSCASVSLFLPDAFAPAAPPAPELWWPRQSLPCVVWWVLAPAKWLWGGTRGWGQAVVSLAIPGTHNIRHWAPGTPGSCSGNWCPGLEGETEMLAVGGWVSSSSMPPPQLRAGAVSGPGDKSEGSLGRGREDPA